MIFSPWGVSARLLLIIISITQGERKVEGKKHEEKCLAVTKKGMKNRTKDSRIWRATTKLFSRVFLIFHELFCSWIVSLIEKFANCFRRYTYQRWNIVLNNARRANSGFMVCSSFNNRNDLAGKFFSQLQKSAYAS